jgi:kynurenine formamidase
VAPADRWWPSEWGPQDQRGAANRITDQRVADAAKLITRGRIYSLGRVYEQGMPLVGNRHFSLTIPGSPTGGPEGKNQLVHHDEMFSGQIGQVGTQFDGLGHVGRRLADGEDYFYNGFKRSEFGKAHGLQKLGVENVGPILTRGVLLDIAGLRGAPLKAGEEVTVSDLAGAARSAGVELREGDAVLIRTGHGQLWMTDNEAYGAGEPGIGLDGAKWLAERKIVLVGCDNWAMEVVPGRDKDRPFQAHEWLIVRNGIYILENLNLEELAADQVYEFAFVFAPLPLKGASGSPGNPVAVK